MNYSTLVLIVLLGIALASAGYGDQGDHGHGVYDYCQKLKDQVKRDKYGVPLNLVPQDSDLVLLAFGVGYRAYYFNSTIGLWIESGRQSKLYLQSDTKFQNIIGDVSTDATTVEPINIPYVYQYSIFEDGSFVTRASTNVFSDYSDPCDPFSGLYLVLASSNIPGIFSGVTYISIYDAKGGYPPALVKKGSPAPKNGEVYISNAVNKFAFYRTSVPSYLVAPAVTTTAKVQNPI